MSLTLGTIVTAARDKSQWFHRSRITDAVIARHLTDVQNELIGAALRRDGQYLAQTANIVLALSGNDAPGTVGPGTAGGVPGVSDASGNFATTESTAGALVEANVTAASGATVWLTDRLTTTVTSTTIQSTGANRSTNQDAGRVLVITTGKGIGQRREILSNTADTWTFSTGSDGQQWTTNPDTTSLFDIVTPYYGSDNAIGVVTGLPATASAAGYLVRLTASGVPFIDFTAPLTATMDVGVPLPSMQFPIDGTVWYADGTCDALAIVDRSRRFSGMSRPAVVIDSQQVFLCGETNDWSGIQSIALRYAPIAPVFAALTDVFLLPDHARPVLVAKAEAFMALRVNGMEGVTIDPASHLASAQAADQSFLANVSQAKRGRYPRIRELW